MSGIARIERKASHAGSWYSASQEQLSSQLDSWISTADITPNPNVRAIIAPHAGYSYSGPAAAWAYGAIDSHQIKRVFILGPSHHVYIGGCALSPCTIYKTPLGDLTIDTDVVASLKATGQFETLSIQADEDEHSVEMHLPYLYKIMSKKTTPYTIVPILVGASRSSDQHNYATIFAPYLADSTNLFIVSSDFCHWGPNFGYTYQFDPSLQIHASIEKLDREAMRVIETGNSKDFEAYLKRTKNTICGRNPIGVLLHALECLENMGKKVDIKFTHYAQSSRALTKRDNSVSYASAHVTLA